MSTMSELDAAMRGEMFRYEGQPVRVAEVEGEPWFVLADLCRILDLGNPTMVAERVEEDALSTAEVIDSMGRNQTARIVSESGMYEVVLQSRKPEARTFKRWLTSEVIPAIRKHGGYLTPAMVEQVLLSPDTIIRLATDLKVEREARLQAEQRAELLTPAAAAWDHMASSAGDWSVQQAAGILARDPSITLGRQRLFDYLGSSHWTFRQEGHWLAYARAIDAGWLSHRAMHHVHPRTGEVVLDPPQIRVTAKGLARLHHLLGGSMPLVALAEAS